MTAALLLKMVLGMLSEEKKSSELKKDGEKAHICNAKAKLYMSVKKVGTPWFVGVIDRYRPEGWPLGCSEIYIKIPAKRKPGP